MGAQSVFITGPKDGEAYANASSALGQAGHIPINPLFIVVTNGGPADWVQRECLVLLIRQATGVALLPGWANDPEARLEHAVALGLGLPVGELHEWTGQAVPRPPQGDPDEDLGFIIANGTETPAFDGVHRAVSDTRCSCGNLYESTDALEQHRETRNA